MANIKRPMFTPSVLEGLCKSIGDTVDGLTGSEIGQILLNADIADIDPAATKWKGFMQRLLTGKIKTNVQIIYFDLYKTPYSRYDTFEKKNYFTVEGWKSTNVYFLLVLNFLKKENIELLTKQQLSLKLSSVQTV